MTFAPIVTTDDPSPYAWAVTGRINSIPHLVNPATFNDNYQALCGASVYLVRGFSSPDQVCSRCRTVVRRSRDV
jgi:hypothetical protein